MDLEVNNNTRKRRNVEQWAKNIRKKKRDSGEEYTSVKGVLVAEKTPPSEDPCHCKFACNDIRHTTKIDLFTKFHKLDYNGQQSFLRGLIRPTHIKRRRHGRYKHTSDSHRQRTYRYMLPLRGESEVQVCKKKRFVKHSVSHNGVFSYCLKK
ncbi:uncharacterized protein LOC120354815 [Nilaparvata lugens]|uniref:uncharacterized protein LOC120354815 n=1 Tax=Nilaparvata lugens TaxID=108931 RepID=UPI00193E28DF|nr:uncharacterized protein LOC120354815 [Nilaparvata lugens]